jgi:hypothetical protein
MMDYSPKHPCHLFFNDCVAIARIGHFAAQLRVIASQLPQSGPDKWYCAYCDAFAIAIMAQLPQSVTLIILRLL